MKTVYTYVKYNHVCFTTDKNKTEDDKDLKDIFRTFFNTIDRVVGPRRSFKDDEEALNYLINQKD